MRRLMSSSRSIRTIQSTGKEFHLVHLFIRPLSSAESIRSPPSVTELSTRIGYAFRDSSLLERALSHPATVSRNATRDDARQPRLEFLGDAALTLVLREALLELYPTALPW